VISTIYFIFIARLLHIHCSVW